MNSIAHLYTKSPSDKQERQDRLATTSRDATVPSLPCLTEVVLGNISRKVQRDHQDRHGAWFQRHRIAKTKSDLVSILKPAMHELCFSVEMTMQE